MRPSKVGGKKKTQADREACFSISRFFGKSFVFCPTAARFFVPGMFVRGGEIAPVSGFHYLPLPHRKYVPF